jgi:hypothetical protein
MKIPPRKPLKVGRGVPPSRGKRSRLGGTPRPTFIGFLRGISIRKDPFLRDGLYPFLFRLFCRLGDGAGAPVGRPLRGLRERAPGAWEIPTVFVRPAEASERPPCLGLVCVGWAFVSRGCGGRVKVWARRVAPRRAAGRRPSLRQRASTRTAIEKSEEPVS